MLDAKRYVPLLKTSVAEVEAYRQLSPTSKDLSFPIFMARPWQNANHIDLTFQKVAAAMEGRPFALGLDSERFRCDGKQPAQGEFDALFDPTLGFRAYYDIIAPLQDCVPVLQPTNDVDVLVRQLARAEELERGLIVHQRRDTRIPMSETVLSLPPLPNDTVFVVDAGWSRDFLQLQSWAGSMVERITGILPHAEIVVMSSSFPDSFNHIVGTNEEAAHETHLFANVRQRYQAANLTLGDWGSTRPSQSGGGGKIPSRIDVPRPASWQIFRADPQLDLGYKTIAQAACAHDAFKALPDCTGRRMIEETDGLSAGITGPQKNTTSRINIHMTIQSGAAGTIALDDEPYSD